MRTRSRFLVGSLDIVFAAQRAGFSLAPLDVHTAVQRGELRPLERSPIQLTVSEANRWLTMWTRERSRRAQERRR
jgi:hypothetical protein